VVLEKNEVYKEAVHGMLFQGIEFLVSVW
jgi:hypothetical protein